MVIGNVHRGYCKVRHGIFKCRNIIDDARRLKSTDIKSNPSPVIPARFETPFVILDTAKRSTCKLTTKRQNILTWYSCGPTVYDSAHIGHASSFIRQDVIRRILEYMNKDLSVIQVMGITNIDDKIIRRANLKCVEWESIAKQYEREFTDELLQLNIIPPTVYTRVTDFIPQILQFVTNLVNNGFAYPVEDGSVYFDSEKFGNKHGIFRQPSVEEEEVADETSGKKSVRDFALWKGAKQMEPYWDSPWGSKKGRPGWHIECSAMASHIFGPDLDLHTGGKDLIFPHHENEEAQCCAHFQSSQWTSHWLHMGHLQFKDDVKMSKSLGNTITIKSFLEENSPDALRMMCIISRYRKDLEYSPDSLRNAKLILNKFQTFLSDSTAIILGRKTVTTSPMGDENLWKTLETAKTQMNTALLDDFDTPEALKISLDLISNFNRHFDDTSSKNIASNSNSIINFELIMSVKIFVQNFLSVVGIASGKDLVMQGTSSSSTDITSVLDQYVEFRNVVRTFSLAMNETDKNVRKEKIKQRKELLNACDTARNRLLEDNNVEVKDHLNNSSWRFTEKTEK